MVRWKNYGLWVAIASVLYMLINDLGLQIDLTKWETYVSSILGILVTLGIISNPEDGRGFFKQKTIQNSSSTNNSMPTQQIESGSTVNNQIMNSTQEMTAQPEQEQAGPDRKYAPYEK
ncbi:hypothetical protein [Bacillus weihaiensis]|uniref:Holin n=1 Tax=Bacillus weihaiensis TaxID=1547283 RepID=A0A1L3MS34_9BACI|nr:hypothetical protein [Bacillus weihaiensis]APH05155.1 hypothetical protein A9C19_10570 [Bacillus weihaiensis]